MNILHICSYYIGNQLYKNLVKELSNKGIKQHVFIPLKTESLVGKNQLPSEYDTVNYYYKNILKKYDKFFYFNKINKQAKEIENLSLLNRNNIDFIHAHTVFSDGGTAYKLSEKYGINFIVTFRNTDINHFYKYAIHLRPYMYRILLNASAVIFISYAYKKQVFSLLPNRILSQIENKCYVIPNGIDSFWHENKTVNKKKPKSREVSLLFIGQLNKNKNLANVLKTCAQLKEQGYNVKLDVIGSGALENYYKNLTKEINLEKIVEFHGFIEDKHLIKTIMDKCNIFIMPSLRETFGLVYIEAMSRGIPIIYSRGQGIDGFFEEGEVGYSVDPLDVSTIVDAIDNIMDNYSQIADTCQRNSIKFNWTNICNSYFLIYNK
ncbi:glycosyltransferase family 4 protein [Anaerobacillus sp. CMMVII]|uniref:glycosyltransferase family 4 protein n=1 Tax=Anaerobacillus sp. CMMVII TaxID=2755588 RepID=UPI0021B7E064|nr:glycosyltransferase family 4 protein [Anaerobacillus sp. CMMVII]MCT8139019.1 glycosyltransferase family 4 protein [Anaerobacillus sp. CMMVII]